VWCSAPVTLVSGYMMPGLVSCHQWGLQLVHQTYDEQLTLMFSAHTGGLSAYAFVSARSWLVKGCRSTVCISRTTEKSLRSAASIARCAIQLRRIYRGLTRCAAVLRAWSVTPHSSRRRANEFNQASYLACPLKSFRAQNLKHQHGNYAVFKQVFGRKQCRISIIRKSWISIICKSWIHDIDIFFYILSLLKDKHYFLPVSCRYVY